MYIIKNDTSNHNRERCFFTCEKNDTSNQKPQMRVSFAPKFPPFIAARSSARHTFNEKSFTERVFLAKIVKNISEMEWNSFVCFTVDKENGREPAKQQRKGINRTRRKLLLYFAFHLSLSLYNLKPAILLKFTHFQLCIENKQLQGRSQDFSKGGSPSGDRRLYMVYTAALPRVSAGSVVLSRHEGPY